MTTYSRYWRKNRSRHEATELVLGLRALRKVAGHIGRNVKPIFWRGMVEEDNRSIIMDTDTVLGIYPISHRNFDILVGRVVLEGLASVEWTDWVSNKVMKNVTDLPDQARPYLESILAAAEDIYVDAMARPNVWTLYLTNLWKTQIYKEVRDPILPPSPESLVNIWRRRVLLKETPDQLHYYYDDPLDILMKYTGAIKELTSLSTPGARREKRVELYGKMWADVYASISEWEEFQQNPEAINMFDDAAAKGELPEMEDPRGDMEAEEDEVAPEGLDPDLAEEVRSILEEGEADLTEDIIVAVQEPEARPMETLFRRGVAKSNVQPDELQVKRLRNIFKEQESLIRKSMRKRIRRGLVGGKLDAHRLYRVPINDKVFKNKQAPNNDHLWQIAIVADASASMAGKGGKNKPWNTAEKTFISVAEAAKGSRNLLDIYAYNAEKNVCTLTQLYHGGVLYSIMPAGRTPSGQAILGAAMVLKRKYKKSMIIHVTDGAANCGLRLGDAIDCCTNMGIEVFTIGCGCTKQTRDFLRGAFPPGHVYFMQSIDYLSVGIEYLFKRKILDKR